MNTEMKHNTGQDLRKCYLSQLERWTLLNITHHTLECSEQKFRECVAQATLESCHVPVNDVSIARVLRLVEQKREVAS